MAEGENKNVFDRIIRYESCEMGEEETIVLFQQLIDSGLAWQLQGHYGRVASHLIEEGLCEVRSE